MGLFLLSVCNIVIVMDDNLANIDVWQYIHTLEMLKWNIPDVSTSNIPPTISISQTDNYHPTSNEFLADMGN